MWGICEYKIKKDSKIFETVNIGAKIPNFLSLRNRSKEDKFAPVFKRKKQKKAGRSKGRKNKGMEWKL